MSSEPASEWVTVASFLGLYSEVEADLLVAALKGSGVPVSRVPHEVPMTVLYGRMMAMFPIRVEVPPEYVREAREIASEQPRQSVPPPVRAVAQWLLAAMVLLPLTGAAFSSRDSGARLVAAISLGCSLGAMWRGVQLLVALRRERRCIPDLAVIGAAALVGLALGLVVWSLPLVLHLHHLQFLDTPWQLTILLALLVVWAAVARRPGRRKEWPSAGSR